MGKQQRALRQKTCRSIVGLRRCVCNLNELHEALSTGNEEVKEVIKLGMEGILGVEACIEEVYKKLWEEIPEDWVEAARR